MNKKKLMDKIFNEQVTITEGESDALHSKLALVALVAPELDFEEVTVKQSLEIYNRLYSDFNECEYIRMKEKEEQRKRTKLTRDLISLGENFSHHWLDMPIMDLERKVELDQVYLKLDDNYHKLKELINKGMRDYPCYKQLHDHRVILRSHLDNLLLDQFDNK